ncbi:MAG: hypothetical protein JRC86_03575 [Deltaproteobacteria bacterium]|nr:hypothetical protein [Deltaproteobacteria bacterium]
MPRETKVKKNRRSEIRQQDVFEHPGARIQPAARPVSYDTKVTPKDTRGGPTQSLLEGLGIVMDTVPYAAKVIDKTAENFEKAGKLAAMSGESSISPKSMVPGARDAFVRGHNMATGMAAVSNFNNLSRAKHNELMVDPEVSPEKYEAEMKGMELSFFAGQNDDWKTGAVSGGALNSRKQLAQEYAAKQHKKLQSKGLMNINGILDLKFGELYAIPAVTERDKMMQAIQARNIISNMQAYGKDYGLDRDMVNASITKHLQPIAQAQGNPNLYSYAFVADESGQKIINTEAGAAISDAMELAAKQQRADIKTKAANKVKADKKKVTDAKRGLSVALGQEDREGLLEASRNFFNLRGLLPPADIDSAVKAIQEWESGAGYSQVGGDLDVYYTLRSAAVDGRMSMGMLNENRHLVTKSQYKELLLADIAEDERREVAAKGNTPPMEGTISRVRTKLKGMLDISDGRGRRKDQVRGPQRANYGSILYDDMLGKFKRNELKWLANPNKRKLPDTDELTKIMEQTAHDMFKKFPATDKKLASKVSYPDHAQEDAKIKPTTLSADELDWDSIPD